MVIFTFLYYGFKKPVLNPLGRRIAPRHCQNQTQINQLIPPLTSQRESVQINGPSSRVSLPNMAPIAKGLTPDGRGWVSAASRIIVPLTSRLIAPHQQLQMLQCAKQDQLTSGQRGSTFYILLCPTVFTPSRCLRLSFPATDTVVMRTLLVLTCIKI